MKIENIRFIKTKYLLKHLEIRRPKVCTSNVVAWLSTSMLIIVGSYRCCCSCHTVAIAIDMTRITWFLYCKTIHIGVGGGFPQNPELDLLNTHKAPHLENDLTLGLYSTHTCFEAHPSLYYFQPKILKLYIYIYISFLHEGPTLSMQTCTCKKHEDCCCPEPIACTSDV
jgi:hypothetical protein